MASDFDSRAEEHPGALSGNSRDQVVDTVSSNGDAHVPPTSAAPLENGSKRKKVSCCRIRLLRRMICLSAVAFHAPLGWLADANRPSHMFRLNNATAKLAPPGSTLLGQALIMRL